MTERQNFLVRILRLHMLNTNYSDIYAVDNETLEALEVAILEDKKRRGLPEIIHAGAHGILFKGCEIVLEVK